MTRFGWLVLVILVVRSGVAAAEPPWHELFATGAYKRAAELARAKSTAPSLAFAARATLAFALTEADGRTETLASYRRAEQDALAALAIDPMNVEASLQLAIALGHRAQLQGPLSADAWELAWATRRHIDTALSQAPGDPWAQALLGAWQMTIAHYAGPLFADVVFDASWADGKRDYLSALRRDPENPLLHFYFAEALRLKDDASEQPMVYEALQRTLQATPASRLERSIQQRAADRLAKLATVR